jgi:hypothetical protein
MNDLLNPYQRNAVTVALRAFEEQLHQFDEWMQGREQVGVLYRRRLSISKDKCALIQGKIAQALNCIAELAVRLELEPQEEDAAATLRAGASACSATLYDVRAGKLKRYGQVDPRLAPMLDPSIETLIELALSLALSLRSDTEE